MGTVGPAHSNRGSPHSPQKSHDIGRVGDKPKSSYWPIALLRTKTRSKFKSGVLKVIDTAPVPPPLPTPEPVPETVPIAPPTTY